MQVAASISKRVQLEKKQKKLVDEPALSLYNLPPSHNVSLDEFESYAIDRLQLLRTIEALRARNIKGSDFQNALKKAEARYMPMTEREQRQKDNTSHFILRLAYCKSEDLRRWFLQHECELFRFRFQQSDDGQIDAFTKVNRKFSEVYTKLFNGGSAKLELVDSDDPLEAGLEMLVSPPGKRLQSITLLSGGEQALTALSLIFAVFLVNPSPICVLDEVDAPLDDANVTRFCSLLDELNKVTKTKFIIITHHALTMSRMHRLYGVTMQEKGVSQLVAVDLQKAEELVA